MRLTNSIQIFLAAFAGLVVAGTPALHAQTPLGGAGSRPVAILLCQYSGETNNYGLMPSDLLGAWMTNTLTVNGAVVDDSINGLVQEASEGTLNFNGSQAFGWFTLPNPLTYYAQYPYGATPDGAEMGANDCIAAAQKNGVNLAPFTYVAVYMNDAIGDGSAAGESFTATLPTKSTPTPWNTLIVCNVGLVSPALVLHELGHILANEGYHTDSGFDPLGAAAYYGQLSAPPVPATASPGWDASRRELMGFIPSTVTFSGTTQTYNISRLTQPYAGLPVTIDVPLPNGAKYVISARTQIGHDALDVYTVANQYGYDGGPTLAVEGVRIELFTSTSVDAHIETSAPIQTPWDAGTVWLTGQTYTDTANGITITVVNFNSTANPTAQITVTSTAKGT